MLSFSASFWNISFKQDGWLSFLQVAVNIRIEYHYERIFRQSVTAEIWWWSGSHLAALGTSAPRLSKLLSGRRQRQVKEHKQKQIGLILTPKGGWSDQSLTWPNPCYSSTHCKAGSVSPGCTFQVLQSRHSVTGQSWLESCSITRNAEKNMTEKTTYHCSNSKLLLHFQENKEQIKIKFIFEPHHQAHPCQTQRHLTKARAREALQRNDCLSPKSGSSGQAFKLLLSL